MNYANFSGKGRKCLVAFFVLIFTFSFSPVQAHASSGFFEGIWCDITGLLGFTCEVPIEAQVLESEVSEATPPPLSKPDDYQIVNSVSEVPAQNTTVIEEHNTYTTNPTTVIYQNSSSEITDSEFLDLFHKLTNLIGKTGQQGSGVSYDLFDKQIDKVFDKSGESVDSVQEDITTLSTEIANSLTTDLLTVSGNATVGSDLVVTGSITAGVLNVAALSSAGALIAPYFTATSTTATSTFMGAVGIGTTTPSSKLTVDGDINISDTGTGYKIGNSRILYASTTNLSTLVGSGAGLALVDTGLYNTALGYESLYTSTSSDSNTAIGYQSLYANTNSNNTAIGYQSLYSNTTGYNNTANGYQTLYFNTTGLYNTADGFKALYSNITGNNNIAIGYEALYSNITGSENTANGRDALHSNTTGGNNIANGHNALYSNTTGSYNTALGRNAGYDINTATSTGANTVIGYNTGRGIVTGVNNTILGANVTGLSSTLSNNIIIADGAGNQRINVGSSGNVGIGTTTPSSKLTVVGDVNIQGTATSSAVITLRDPIGNISLELRAGTSTLLNTFVGLGAGSSNTSGTYNTATGYLSLYSNTTGTENTANGRNALYSNTTGSYNTAIGNNALYSNATGTLNTAIGVNALYSNTSGSYNTANGLSALFSNTTGSSNTANGYQSLKSNTTGTNNTANGYSSLYSNTTGSHNTVNGTYALFSNISGSYNTTNGYLALYSNTTGDNNTANGMYSLYSNTTGTNNTALGRNSLYSNITGSYNTALGFYAGYDINTATSTGSNTIIGYNTGRGIVTGINNTILGANITGLSSTLSNNIIIADGTGNQRINVDSSGNVGIGTSTPQSKLFVYDTDRATNAIANVNIMTSNTQLAGMGGSIGFGGLNDVGSTNPYIFGKIEGVSEGSTGWSGALLFSTTNTGSSVSEKMRITSEGKVGIGTTSPSAKLTVTQSAQSATGGFWLSTSDNTDFRSQFMDTSGVLSFYGGDTAGTLNTATLNAAGEWTNASDISYKENIEKLSYGLETVLALQPRSYDIKNTDNHRIGFIAQEVEEVIPEVVSGKDGAKGISYGNLVAVAISAIQELAQKVNGFTESITTKFMKADQVETNTLCLDGLCITKSQLQDILNNQTGKNSEQIPTSSTPEIEENVESSEETGANAVESTTELDENTEESESDTELPEPVVPIQETSTDVSETVTLI